MDCGDNIVVVNADKIVLTGRKYSDKIYHWHTGYPGGIKQRTARQTAYYGLRQNPKDEYLVLSCDGAGDGVCATVSVMGNGSSREIARTPWENSLGALYSWTTYALGFVPLEHEYKLMGMAPYASEEGTEKLANVFRNYIGLDAEGTAFQKRTSQRTNDLNATLTADLRGQRFDWICAGLQRFTEELLCGWVKAAIEHTGVKKVVGAGGVFMNVKANQAIAALPEVEHFEAYPSCGDEDAADGRLRPRSRASLR